jgi:hypothetical protein
VLLTRLSNTSSTKLVCLSVIGHQIRSIRPGRIPAQDDPGRSRCIGNTCPEL